MIKQIYVDMTKEKGITLKQDVKVACASCKSCKEIIIFDLWNIYRVKGIDNE